MRDQTAFARRQISGGAGRRLNAVQNVGKVFEFDFRDGEAGALAGVRHRDLHARPVRGEFDRPEPGGVLARLAEGRRQSPVVAGMRNPTVARYCHGFLAGAVDLRDFGDRWRIGEDAAIILDPLLRRRGARPRRPADLTFERGKELLDPLGRLIGFFALRMQQHVLGVAVGDPDVDGAADGQDEGDQPDEIGDVFGEEAPLLEQVSQQVGGRSCQGRLQIVFVLHLAERPPIRLRYSGAGLAPASPDPPCRCRAAGAYRAPDLAPAPDDSKAESINPAVPIFSHNARPEKPERLPPRLGAEPGRGSLAAGHRILRSGASLQTAGACRSDKRPPCASLISAATIADRRRSCHRGRSLRFSAPVRPAAISGRHISDRPSR